MKVVTLSVITFKTNSSKEKKKSISYYDSPYRMKNNKQRTQWLDVVNKEETKVIKIFEDVISMSPRSITKLRENNLISDILYYISDDQLKNVLTRNDIKKLSLEHIKDNFIREDDDVRVNVAIDGITGVYYGHVCYGEDHEGCVSIYVIKMSLVNTIKRKMEQGCNYVIQLLIVSVINEMVCMSFGHKCKTLTVSNVSDDIVDILGTMGFTEMLNSYVLEVEGIMDNIVESYVLTRY